MKERRSASQVLFGFLPDQTVDLRGGVWRVARWRQPILQRSIDSGTLTREIKRQALQWRDAGKDGGLVSDLDRGVPVRVYALDKDAGVQVDAFPRIWHCKQCRRLTNEIEAKCVCGSTGRPGQLPFVGYCSECGTLRQPYIRKCPEHGQHRVNWPGTASAREIIFDCPVCSRRLQEGLGMPSCDCGRGHITFSVHRAASVYTARSVVIVNPPSIERIREIAEAGGPPRALAWVVNGMSTRRMSDSPTPVESVRRQLTSSGLSSDQIEQMLKVLDVSARDPDYINEFRLANSEEAERQAVSIALATSEARITLSDLNASASGTGNEHLYRVSYAQEMSKAGIDSIELVDRFPVMTGMFGYTRGNPAPGASRLVAFREAAGYTVYADLAETEALFVRLDANRVCRWLANHGCRISTSERSAALSRIAILQLVAGDSPESVTASNLLFSLVHSFCHRFIRLAAVFGGIERNALSELVTPLHLGFFVYAASRGDFVLGGLQALFETELDGLLRNFTGDDHRCPLDPGCNHGGGACMACLHLGEPSCRHFNNSLSRATLAGERGYLDLL